ncbi:L-demethylnoviosyl transferase [Baekduia alba]|uniref:glycosyltransferase n=1 Tax=Baekduia alba TaxID=2997333 RepID=UPI002341CCAC|nr:glycosyltransferase [Baekduia alba]WCB92345.1 L-demethylnoviosyl transferase [Baekduia alba]
MRLLLTSTHGMGHAMPLMPFARACRDAGHDVLLAGPHPIAEVAAREGLTYQRLPWPDEERLAAVRRLVAARQGMARVKTAMSDLFVRTYARAALPGTLALVEDWRPDAILHETAEASALIAGDALGVPTLRVGVALATPYEEWWLSMTTEALDEVRAEAGLTPDPGALRAAQTPVLTQVPAALDAYQGPPPAHVHRYRDEHVGAALAPGLESSFDHYAWPDPDAPLVPISFGTMVPTDGHFPSLYRAAIDAVADLPIRVLVTVGRHADPATLGPLPANVRAERWIPMADVLPHAAAFVTHGGAGTTLAALAAGVPMALLAISADQPLNARLVARLGAGLALEGGPGQAPALGALVKALLDDDRHAAAARRIADEIAALPPIAAAVGEIEGRAAGAQPWAVGTTMSSAMFTRGGAATA